MHTVSILIPTWNGLPLLQAHLPALLEADGVRDAELIIADDGSTDGTADWVRLHVPQARVVRLEHNGGFSAICNAALAEAHCEFVLLLNNDVRVTPGFLPPLVEALAADPDAFAVNGRILLSDGRDEGQKAARLHHGLFYIDSVPGADTPAPALYATGGAALYRRRRVMALGGFDPLFSPAYWEDVDLSFRAWRRGWTVWHQPASVVYHQHEATTGRLPRPRMARVRARNGFLFLWKNMPLRRVWQSVTLGPAVGLWHLLRDRDPSVLLGWGDALRLWRRVLVRRAGERRAAIVSGADILAQFAPPEAAP